MSGPVCPPLISRIAAVLVFLAGFGLASRSIVAQSSSADAGERQPEAVTPTSDPGPQHDMHDMQTMRMSDDESASMPPAREGSGTAWLPDETPMYMVHRAAGGWMLMAHANAFLQYLHDDGDRGSEQVGSINWLMGMAERPAAGGRFSLRGMVSLEPWTIRGCGYPDLLASGEICQGAAIHDRQHPHDLFMELAAEYDHPIAKGLHLQLYGGPVGEPALGPVAFPHRISAMSNPLAPMTHHWFDATHITYGVVTGGVYGRRWKAETSVFNGREPDETRTDFDFGRLDSWSGRVWWLPTNRWALQVSAGHLTQAEAGENGSPRVDVTRATASVTYHRLMMPGTIWASTIGWGRNAEPGSDASNALLAETSLTLRDRDTWFGRFELAQKSGHDLAIDDLEDLASLAKLQGGYTRYWGAWSGWTPGVGGTISLGIVPESLRSAYGGRANFGYGVFLTLRPAVAPM